MLRLIIEGRIKPDEAVRAYHGVLQSKGVKLQRSLQEDLRPTNQAMAYAGNARSRSTAQVNAKPQERRGDENLPWPKMEDGSPDFERMNPAQRNAYDKARLNRKFGG
jgi:hypothetical protein